MHVYPQKGENKCSYCYKIYSSSDENKTQNYDKIDTIPFY